MCRSQMTAFMILQNMKLIKLLLYVIQNSVANFEQLEIYTF